MAVLIFNWSTAVVMMDQPTLTVRRAHLVLTAERQIKQPADSWRGSGARRCANHRTPLLPWEDVTVPPRRIRLQVTNAITCPVLWAQKVKVLCAVTGLRMLISPPMWMSLTRGPDTRIHVGPCGCCAGHSCQRSPPREPICTQHRRNHLTRTCFTFRRPFGSFCSRFRLCE